MDPARQVQRGCGAAAARHLDKIVDLADDDDWWVRAGVAYVLRYVGDPATGEHAGSTIANFLSEQSVFGKNRFRNALTEMAKRGHATEAIVETVDIFPTLCEAAGAEYSHPIDGRSFLSTLLGMPADEP